MTKIIYFQFTVISSSDLPISRTCTTSTCQKLRLPFKTTL